MIALTSLVPRWIGGTSLSAVVLKSYLLSRRPRLRIPLSTFFADEDPGRIAEAVMARGLDVMGFSVYMWNLEAVLEVCRRIKEKKPESFLILGGPTASFQADTVMEGSSSVDMIVKGEGELPLFEVLSSLEAGSRDFDSIPNLVYRRNGRIVRTPEAVRMLPLEEQEHPLDVSSFEEFETVYYETSRGCVFSCNYCAWNTSQYGRKRFRYYPLDKVLKELEGLFRLPRLALLLLTDSNILLGGERTREIFARINALNQERRERGQPLVKINFEFNPEHLREEMMPEIKRLYVENYPVGLQSVNAGVLKEANRPFHRDKYLRNIRMLREKVGAAILVEIIYGLPTDTYEGFRETLEFVLSEMSAELFVCYRFSVLPGSVFWEKRDEYGIRCQEESPHLILSSDTFGEEDFAKADELAYYLQIIFRTMRSLKKHIDKMGLDKKLPAYEALVAMLSSKYGDFLSPKLVYDDGFLEDVEKLRSRENADIRRRMMADARRVLKAFGSPEEGKPREA